MAHYSVLVTIPKGKTLEEVMLPYHEYESTGIRAYTKFTPLDNDDLETLRSDYKEYGEDYSSIESYAENECGYEFMAGVFGNVTNPNARWDWYVVGGRYKNSLVNTSINRCDYGKVGDIRFDLIKEYRRNDALESYDKLQKALSKYNGVDAVDFAKSYESVWNWISDIEVDMDKFLLAKMVQASRDLGWFVRLSYVMSFHEDRDVFAGRERGEALTYAYVDLDGKWISRGDIGWFGTSSNESDSYDEKFWEFVDGLGDNVDLVVVDCHI